MYTAAEIRSRANAYAAQLLIGFFAAFYGIAAILFLPALQQLHVPAIYLLLAVLIYANVIAVMIARCGQNKVSSPVFVGGVVLTFGGAIFDMIATVVHSPSLTLEGNYIARLLIDSGHSLSFIYGYAIAAQFLAQLLLCILWAAFLRHKDTLVTLVWETNPISKGDFVKAALGGEGYTWRQYLFKPKRGTTFYKRAWYHILLAIACIALIFDLFRWWLGAEWFGIVPNVTDAFIGVPLMILGIVVYVMWLVREYEKGAPANNSNTSP